MAPLAPISTLISPAWHSRSSLWVQSVAEQDATAEGAAARFSWGLAI